MGASVLGLYTNYRTARRYQHFEYFYASALAVVASGRQSAPFTSIPQAWRNPKSVAPHPYGGDAATFSVEAHLAGFTHVLIRHGDEPGEVADPLDGRSEVERVVEAPPCRLYAVRRRGERREVERVLEEKPR